MRDSSLGLLNLMAEFLKGSLVILDINLRLSQEFSNAEVNKSGVKIVSSESGVSLSSFHFEDSVLNVDDRAVERATSKIKDTDIAFLGIFFVKAESNSSSNRLAN